METVMLKVIGGYILLAVSVVLLYFIYGGFKEVKEERKSVVYIILVFLGYTWQLWSLFLLCVMFGLMLISKFI